MLKTAKKILCTFIIVVMCLTSAPLDGFVDIEWPVTDFGEFSLSILDIDSWFSSKATAADLAATGYCGIDVRWNYDSATGKLIIIKLLN